DPKGSLRLEGQVIDADEHPVGGATVVLGSNPPRTATTETDGGFAFDGLVGRSYALIARAPSGVAGPVTAKLTGKSDPVVLRLRPAGKLTVTVTADGKPIDATVELRGLDEQRETARGGVATFNPVAAGGYQIAAWAEGKARAFAWVQVGAGDAEAKLSLVAGAAVSGRVLDDKGAPVAGARVRYAGASDWTQQSNDRLDAAMSGGDGSFAFDALPAGTFRFIATHGDLAPGTSALVTLDGRTARDNVTIQMALGAVVRGRVVDGSKNPLASARVRVGVASARMIAEGPRQAFTDAKGAFEIKGVPRKPMSAVALHESGSSQTMPVDTTNGDAEVTLVVDVTGSIAGIVVDPQGNPMEGVQVSAGPNLDSARGEVAITQWRLRGFPQELTDAGGKFTLTGLAPGDYTVTAAPAASAGRNRRNFGEGTPAKTGDTNLRIVLPPEGAVKGRVAFADGTAPQQFSVSVGMSGQSFGTDGAFVIDALPPQKYEITVRGPSFQTRVVETTVESSKTVDLGTVTVVKGRIISGVVLADGQPVAGAKVSAGRMMFGNGTQSNQPMGPMGANTKSDTTDERGAFSLSGFPDGDLTIVAEHDTIGRSRALRLPTVMPGQTELTLTLEKFGSLSGVLRSEGKPSEGVFVSVQSTTSPGAIFGVATGPDGAYRYDRLAPDTYKVSAMGGGMPMRGMRFYSKQVDVPPGREVHVDLAVEEGAITLEMTAVPKAGTLGVVTGRIVSGTLTARTLNELDLRMAAAGPGTSAMTAAPPGRPLAFQNLVAGTYTACAVPFPVEVKEMMAVMGYAERHGDSLLAFCKTVTVAAAPATQSLSVQVELPPFISDAPPGGGSGSGG
ncbi:MAG: carboxypeptidase regulatory-like domain-containing protein, partial [Deltaproteobacteria bacterium]|nr:carboxypeptidase regulatory-like domain-containing protein [Deltaproteobacteria bacterium]